MDPQSTDERDTELSGLDKELADDPHIHRPDDIKIGDGTMCWLNQERMCGGDCTAFNWEMRGESPNQCVILYHMGAMGSGAIGFIHSLNLSKRSQEDTQRQDATNQEVPKV